MASQLEHMQADYALALAEGGVEVVLDGVEVLVFLSPEEITPSEFERTLLIRRRVGHLLADVTEKAPGQVVSLGTVRWEVVSHSLGRVGGILILQRQVG